MKIVVPEVYAIADQDTLGGERLPEVAAALAEAGVGWIQLRMKRASGAQAFRLVEATLERLEGTRTKLWIDDRVDLAALFPVYGVHVGQDDLPPEAVRRVVGEGVLIGRSTHDEDELRQADADPAVDVVAFGPVFPTRSKERPDPVVGTAGLERARRLTSKPLVAIGGIGLGNLAAVLRAGADSAAMIGAFGDAATSPGEVVRRARGLLAAARGGKSEETA